MSDSLLVTVDDGVATLTLNRPESLNSLDTALKEALSEAVTEVGPMTGCVRSC